MSLADELTQLEQLHARGALSAEEYANAKARLLAGERVSTPPLAAINRFRRSRTDRWLGGVCGGLATLTGMDSWVWRLLLVLLAVAGGTGVFLYILLWIFVPDQEA